MVSVKKRVFETPSRPMPPNFGTPLTPNELAALKKYLSDLEKTPDPTVSPTATQPGEPATPVVKFSEVKPYFSTYCGATGGCHGPTNEATGPYVTLEQIKPARSKLRARMVRTDSGKMPKEGSPQPADAEKTKMLDWLQNGSDD
jgi:hypothetical protein